MRFVFRVTVEINLNFKFLTARQSFSFLHELFDQFYAMSDDHDEHACARLPTTSNCLKHVKKEMRCSMTQTSTVSDM